MITIPCQKNNRSETLMKSVCFTLFRRIIFLRISLKLLIAFFLTQSLFITSSAFGENNISVIKSEFLIKFCLYIEWPESKFMNQSSSLVIGVGGDYNQYKNLKHFAFNKKSHDRNITVVQASPGDNMDLLHVLYLPERSQYTVAEFSRKSNMSGVLVITDVKEKNIRQQGMINFIEVAKKIKFDINMSQLENSGLKVGAELLSVGRQIKDGN